MSNKILVVDDDPATRELLRLSLGPIGEVLFADGGDAAIRLIMAERPRLMLLDMTMPGMSGIEVLEVCKRSGVVMTILVLTGRADIDLAKKAIELGAVEYITKPFDLPYLKDRVLRCVKAIQAESNEDGGIPWRTVPEVKS